MGIESLQENKPTAEEKLEAMKEREELNREFLGKYEELFHDLCEIDKALSNPHDSFGIVDGSDKPGPLSFAALEHYDLQLRGKATSFLEKLTRFQSEYANASALIGRSGNTLIEFDVLRPKVQVEQIINFGLRYRDTRDTNSDYISNVRINIAGFLSGVRSASKSMAL